MNETGIIWTEATNVVDRNGKRIRIYKKKTDAPPKKLRKQMLVNGFGWCRECKNWVNVSEYRGGICKTHANAAYRLLYRSNPEKIRQRAKDRKRKLNSMPSFFKSFLFDKVDSKCVYCGNTATALDHVIAVKNGGNNYPTNLVPCCTSCNSKKKDRSLNDFLKGNISDTLIDLLSPTLTNFGNFKTLLS